MASHSNPTRQGRLRDRPVCDHRLDHRHALEVPVTSTSISTIDRSKDRLVRLPEVRSLTGLSTATIYRKMDAGQSPPKV